MEITGNMQQAAFALNSAQNADMQISQARLSRAEGAPKGRSAFARMLEADPQQDAKLKESCIQMESIFVKQMLTVMRKSVEKTGLIDGGQAEEIFTDMLYDKYAEEMSRSHTLGLARTIYSQLTGGKKWA
jgi:flagellar protein FlgJ